MGSELFCELRISSNQRVTYWWPLIFESMYQESLVFTAPGEPEGTGYYYYIHQADETDTDFVKASFRTVWDEINAETSQMLISFWSLNRDAFPLDVSIEKKGVNTILILISLNDAYLIDLPLEAARQRLKTLLNCARSAYVMCKPCIGKIYWEGIQTPLALLGNASEIPSPADSTKFVEEHLPDGSSMYLLDPAPIKVRGGWDFVSLIAE